MISATFPRTQGTLSRETYLTLILLALVQQADGELHLSASSLESIDGGGRVLIDWDSSAQQLVIRAGSPSLVVAEVRGGGWTTQPATQSPSSPTPPQPSTHRVMTEDQLIDALSKKMQADRLREWRQQGADITSNLAQPDDGTPH